MDSDPSDINFDVRLTVSNDVCLMSALHHNLCHWDHNPNLWILIPVTHLDCVSSVFLLDYGSRAILWIVFLVSTLDSVYISF